MQSIKSDMPGMVKVSLETFIDHYVIAVEDNGQGISKEQQEKIFVPNFTTKSSGMGLGLAMVKSIVESAGGKISFESEEQKGKVVEEIEKGYYLNDKVIRHAKVIVAN